jgi:thiamine biosynthesis lipoprotein
MTTRTTTFAAIGTHWKIDVHEKLSANEWANLKQAIQSRIELFDRTYSRFRADSMVSRMSNRPGTYELPSDADALLAFYQQLYDVTDGLVTPTIGSVISDLGYDDIYSLQAKSSIAPAPTWHDTMEHHGSRLSIKQPVLLDFGAAGKGYLVDIVGDIIESFNIRSYGINAGGDILYHSADEKPVEIGLENPFDSQEVIGSVTLTSGSLCASSTTKRAWGEHHHIAHPAGNSVSGELVAAWVLADTTMLADGLATALFFVAADRLQEEFEFEYALLKTGMELEYSRGFPLKMFDRSGR